MPKQIPWNKKPLSLYPDLRFELSNGRTLCKPCHEKHGWQFFRETNPKIAKYNDA